MKTCLKSIEQQTFQDFEVIIVDGSSTDGTPNYLKKLQYPFRVLCEPDDGVYDAMNKGIVLAQGEWLYFMGCDDRLISKNILEILFQKNLSNTDLILGSIKYENSSNNSFFLNRKSRMVYPSWGIKLWIKNSIHHQGAFYKSELFDQEKFDLAYKILADYNLNLQLFRRGVNVRKLEELIAICGPNGLSKSNEWKIYREEIRLKVNNSTFIFKPLFFLISLSKYLIKQLSPTSYSNNTGSIQE
ncbi:glycosyltransferase family 2 protein [Urechidicola sp. KH5]